MNDTVMQDSQDPYDTSQSSMATSSISSYIFKNKSELKSMENKRRNKAAHEDYTEMYNITDPTTTPSDTLDDDYKWAWNDVDMDRSP